MRATIPLFGDLPTWKPRNRFLDYGPFLIPKVPESLEEESFGPKAVGFVYSHDYLGDIGLELAYGDVSENGVIRSAGITVVWPTSEDRSAARGQTLLGPEIALGRITDKAVYGFRAKHLTDVWGESQAELFIGKIGTNDTTLQLFGAYSLGNGWQIESKPTIRYDWEAVDNNKWSVPLGGGISKTFRLGRWPMKLGVEYEHYVVTPDRFGPDCNVRLNFVPFVSTKMLR